MNRINSQYALPVFDGLLPGIHNEIVMDLLFTLNEWMGIAKLRLMTEDTRQLLRDVTADLGFQIRRFRFLVCPFYKTKAIQGDETARGKKENGPYPKSVEHEEGVIKLNINRFKFHALSHYADAILMHGTTDSYSTQLVRGFFLLFETDLTYKN